MSARILGIWVFGCLGIFFLPGCGDNLPDRAPVSGAVTFNGQAVTAGTITFYPASGRPAMGKIQPDGTYRLATFGDNDGAFLGEHQVTIEATQVADSAGPRSFEEELRRTPPSAPTAAATVAWLVPQQFAARATSPLTATVKASENRIDFHLPIAN